MRYVWPFVLIMLCLYTKETFAQGEKGRKGLEVLYVSYDFPGSDEQKQNVWKLEIFKNVARFAKATLTSGDSSNVSLEENEFGEPVLKLNFPNKNDSTIYFSNLSDSTILSREYIFNNGNYDSYLVQEDFPRLKWSIREKYKQVDGHKLQMAEADFRGRHYIAWFSLEYPIFFGPWKLHGLPGLVFELTDTSNRIRYELIKLKSTEFDGELTLYAHKNDKKVTLEEFVKLKNVDKADEKIKSYILSKLPRGSVVNINEVVNTNLELEFN